MKRILATFHPQFWMNGYAVECDDGTYTVDVTDKVLHMGKDKALTLKDDTYETDDLIQHDHSGPFYVEVQQSIEDYFNEVPS